MTDDNTNNSDNSILYVGSGYKDHDLQSVQIKYRR